MPPPYTHSTKNDGAGLLEEPMLRVVLTGRSIAEGALRKKHGTEILRAASPMEALGELHAAGMDTAAHTTVVLVTEGAIETEQRTEFVEAVRTVAPDATVVGLGDAGHDLAFDAWLPLADVSTDAVLLAVEQAAAAHPATGHTTTNDPPATKRAAGYKPVEPTTNTLPADAAIKDGTKDNQGPLERVLADQDPTDAFLEHLARQGAQGVRFVNGANSNADGAHAEPVHRGGELRGWLLWPAQLDTTRAAHAAKELAAWLALRDDRERLRRDAHTDELTGAVNRRGLLVRLRAAMLDARKQRREIAALFCDVDDFKQYNSGYGHAAGDLILRETVKLLGSVIRPCDWVARLGGDEFVVVFDDPEGPRAGPSNHAKAGNGLRTETLVRRIQARIAQQRFPALGEDAPGKLRISGGLAVFPWDGHDAETLLATADQRAARSKAMGKDQVTLGPEHPESDASDHWLP